MSLKITLRPGERIFIAGAVLKNGPNRSMFIIENKIPLLREREIMLEEEVDTVAKKIYFLLQAMYMEIQSNEHHSKLLQEFERLTSAFVKAAPSSAQIILEITQNLLAEDLYRALRTCRKLIDLERERVEQFRTSQNAERKYQIPSTTATNEE